MTCSICGKNSLNSWMKFKENENIKYLCSYLCFIKHKKIKFADVINQDDFTKDPIPFCNFNKPKKIVSEFKFLSDNEVSLLTDVEKSKYEHNLKKEFMINEDRTSYILEMINMSNENYNIDYNENYDNDNSDDNY